jgi:hypothetical protein
MEEKYLTLEEAKKKYGTIENGSPLDREASHARRTQAGIHGGHGRV